MTYGPRRVVRDSLSVLDPLAEGCSYVLDQATVAQLVDELVRTFAECNCSGGKVGEI